MMNRARGDMPRSFSRDIEEVDLLIGRLWRKRQASSSFFIVGNGESEKCREKLRRCLPVVGAKRRRVKLLERELRSNRALLPSFSVLSRIGFDQLESESVRIMEANERLTETWAGLFNRDVVVLESPGPIFGRARRHSVTCGDDLASADAPASSIGPWKECDDCARVPNPVAEVKVIGARIVEVDRPLHQTQAQNARIEVEVSLRVTRDCSDMMN